MDKEVMQCNVTYTEEQLNDYSFVVYAIYGKPMRNMYVMLIFTFLLLSIISLHSLQKLILYICMIVILYIRIKQQQGRIYRQLAKNYEVNGTHHFVFYPSYMQFDEMALNYSDIIKLAETEENLFIFDKPRHALIINKIAVNEYTQLRQLLMKGSNRSCIDLGN